MNTGTHQFVNVKTTLGSPQKKLTSSIMVDIERRKKLAFHLRHLSIGLITNDEFESNLLDDITYGWLPEQYYRAKESKLDDSIIGPMLELCWGLYDDTRRHKLIGSDKLSSENLKIIARCILFLHSEREYEWPYQPIKLSWLELLTAIFTLGLSLRIRGKLQEKSYEEFKKFGDFDFWPFLNSDDYESELKHHPFLNGQRSGFSTA